MSQLNPLLPTLVLASWHVLTHAGGSPQIYQHWIICGLCSRFLDYWLCMNSGLKHGNPVSKKWCTKIFVKHLLRKC